MSTPPQPAKRFSSWGPAPLYLTAFLMDNALLMSLTAIPFIVVSLGGNRTQAGDYLFYQFIIYTVTCVFSGIILDRIAPKRAVQLGAAGVLSALTGILIILMLNRTGHITNAVGKLAWPIAAVGLPLTFFWPALMGWLSRGREGQQLSKRLGWFNLSWSIGAITGPLVAGFLLQWDHAFTIMIAVIVGLLGFIAVSIAQNDPAASASPSSPPHPGGVSQELMILDQPAPHPNLKSCRWIARISLYMAMLCCYVCRSQLGLLMREDLGYSEAMFGTLMMMFSVVNCLAMFSLSRWHFWHYRPAFFFLSQLGLIIAMLMLARAVQIPLLALAVILIGMTSGFFYTTHLYYGASGSKNRAACMALHELINGAGAASGSFMAGRLCDTYNVRAPYFVAAVLAAIVLVAQLILWAVLRPQRRQQSQSVIDADGRSRL